MPNPETDLPNARSLDHGITSGGQPSEAHLHTAQRAGVKTVVNLRPEHEFTAYDEPALAADLGLRYINIPVAGPRDLTRENADKLDQALTADQATPAIVHCASGNRVGALLAYRARYISGETKDRALQIGLNAGLQPDSPLFTATEQALE